MCSRVVMGRVLRVVRVFPRGRHANCVRTHIICLGHSHPSSGCARTHKRRYRPGMAAEMDPVGAWAALLRVHAAVVPKLARELAGHGLPIAWYDVLLVLNAAPGRKLRMTELGASAVLSRERISRVVGELEDAGLVRREPNPEDRQVVVRRADRGGPQAVAGCRADVPRRHRGALHPAPRRQGDQGPHPRAGEGPGGRGAQRGETVREPSAAVSVMRRPASGSVGRRTRSVNRPEPRWRAV